MKKPKLKKKKQAPGQQLIGIRFDKTAKVKKYVVYYHSQRLGGFALYVDAVTTLIDVAAESWQGFNTALRYLKKYYFVCSHDGKKIVPFGEHYKDVPQWDSLYRSQDKKAVPFTEQYKEKQHL